jgi:hypothetical protein
MEDPILKDKPKSLTLNIINNGEAAADPKTQRQIK